MSYNLTSDSATLQSTQWIINAAFINAHYNQRLFSLLILTTKYEANTSVALSSTTSVVKDLNEKIAGVDCMMR
jgi:hypothetical protein